METITAQMVKLDNVMEPIDKADIKNHVKLLTSLIKQVRNLSKTPRNHKQLENIEQRLGRKIEYFYDKLEGLKNDR